MQDKPSSLLRHFQVAGNFVGRNTILAVHQEPHCRRPLLQRNGRILKNGSKLYRELASAVAALPTLLCLDPVRLFRRASRAMYAVRPTHFGNGVYADLFVGEVLNGLL